MTAIELKYFGNSHKKISEKIQFPFDTVDGWFKSRGKLSSFYKEYVDKINKKRERNLLKNISVSDEEFLILTTNIVRQFSKRLQKRKAPLVNRKGQLITDDNGNQIFRNVEPDVKFTVRELKIAWEMQRIMRGLPIKYEKQIEKKDNLEANYVIEEMGLSSEDFEDENLKRTTTDITKHLLCK